MVGAPTPDRNLPATEEEHHRLCVATRARREPGDLIRFVAGPDGIIVPDLARRLPGRGVWVTADRDSIAKAVATRAFARSLKRKVTAPDDLAGLVERQLDRRVADTLALANKAGAVLTGFEKIDRALAAGDVEVLVHACEAASDGREKLDRKFLAVAGGVAARSRIVSILTVDQMSLAIGRPNVVHAALNKGGISDRFLIEAGRLSRFRSGIGHSGMPPGEVPDTAQIKDSRTEIE